MQIRKFGHACLHILDGDASILIDPGTFSTGYDELSGLTAVLITHSHADHVDTAGLARVMARNPRASVYGDEAVVAALADDDATKELAISGVHPGDTVDVGASVEVFGGEHAVIHADLQRTTNVGYVIGGRLAHPGDSLVAPPASAFPGDRLDILAVPASAPWMAVKEGVDYLRAVRPAHAIPIHEKVLSTTSMAYHVLNQLRPETTEWHNIDDGSVLDL